MELKDARILSTLSHHEFWVVASLLFCCKSITSIINSNGLVSLCILVDQVTICGQILSYST